MWKSCKTIKKYDFVGEKLQNVLKWYIAAPLADNFIRDWYN